MRIILLQGSLNPQSKTAVLLQELTTELQTRGIDHVTLDLRQLDMQFCDGRPLEQYNASMQDAFKLLASADACIIGMPVYQYSIAGPLKNFLDITLDALEKKVVAVACASGGPRSYLASVDLMKAAMFEVESVCVPSVLHVSGGDVAEGKLVNESVQKRIAGFIDAVLHAARP
jgi:NAD(P)H-dependent FMN reductase